MRVVVHSLVDDVAGVVDAFPCRQFNNLSRTHPEACDATKKPHGAGGAVMVRSSACAFLAALYGQASRAPACALSVPRRVDTASDAGTGAVAVA